MNEDIESLKKRIRNLESIIFMDEYSGDIIQFVEKHASTCPHFKEFSINVKEEITEINCECGEPSGSIILYTTIKPSKLQLLHNLIQEINQTYRKPPPPKISNPLYKMEV